MTIAPLLPAARFLGLVGLCAAYIQGGLSKLFDFPGAIAEQVHFGLHPPMLFAVATIVTELAGSAMVLTGWFRWVGALWLAGFTVVASFIANAFWTMPPGMDRFMAGNAFWEHLGLAGGFLLVAAMDRK